MATSSRLLMVAAILAFVLFVGSVQAGGGMQCPSGYKGCNSKKPGCETCIDYDVNNCGDCGKKCKSVPYANVKCDKGYCKYECQSGWGNCDGKWDNGCEKDLSKDVYNCGKCGNKCPCTLKYGEPTCSGGKCGQQCKSGMKYDDQKKCCV